MISDAVKIARINKQTAEIQAVKDILTNPVIMAVAGVIAVEFMQSSKVLDKTIIYSDGSKQEIYKRIPSGGIVGSVAGSVLEAGIAGYLLTAGIPDTSKEKMLDLGVNLVKGAAKIL